MNESKDQIYSAGSVLMRRQLSDSFKPKYNSVLIDSLQLFLMAHRCDRKRISKAIRDFFRKGLKHNDKSLPDMKTSRFLIQSYLHVYKIYGKLVVAKFNICPLRKNLLSMSFYKEFDARCSTTKIRTV